MGDAPSVVFDSTASAMPAQASALMLQFLEWVAGGDRTYADAMDAWRTSCPRLSIWEDALDGGLIVVEGGVSRMAVAQDWYQIAGPPRRLAPAAPPAPIPVPAGGLLVQGRGRRRN